MRSIAPIIRPQLITRRSRAARQRCCSTNPRILFAIAEAAGHNKPHHPETAGRITAICAALQQHGLLDHQQVTELCAGTRRSAADVAAALQLVHPPSYIERVRDICSSLQEATMIDESTYISPGSFDACCEAAAAVLSVLDAVLANPTACGVCLVRPPGHHVLPTRPMGFGLFNLVATAARAALSQQTTPVRKVLIVDFDVHHGNGTEEIFYQDDSVLYISTHQQRLWPYTGKVTQCGAGAGAGYTINLPLPGGCGHAAMELVLSEVVWPAARRFQPDLVLVSAGYDAHWRDPLAGLQFESRTYHFLFCELARLATELCGGRGVFVLEGGYHQPSLGEAVADSFLGILGQPALQTADAPRGLQPEPLDKLQALLSQARRLHQLD